VQGPEPGEERQLIISTEELADSVSLSAQLAVVGAGPAGIVIALEAAKNGFDVLLLESGYDGFNSAVQELSEAEAWNPDVHEPMSKTVRRQLGGTSTIWGGRCVPYDPVDFDRRDRISDTHWPVAYEELSSYFQRACDWLKCGRAVFDVTHMPHLPASLVPGLPNGDASTASLERWSLSTDFAREYADELKRSTRIRVVTGLTCTEVSSPHGLGCAEHLACRALDGKHVTVRAHSYVLACGGLETTRLLLSSRGPYGGALGDHSGHLGSWYMGHVDGVVANVRFRTPPRATVFGYERDIDGTYVRRRFSVSRESQLRHGAPNVIAFLANPALADYRHGNGILSLAYLALRSPFGHLAAPPEQRLPASGDKSVGSPNGRGGKSPVRPHLMNIARDSVPVARFAVGLGARRVLARGHATPGFFTAYSRDNLYPLQYHGEQVPNRKSRVSVTDNLDSLGMPKLSIDLRFSQQDVDGILQCHQIWDKYLRQNNCGHLEYISDDTDSAVWEQVGGVGSHQLGTTRMAARSEDGVVDRNLAVHGVGNLYVASSSVFLTSSQANPTFMIIAFALRLADRLKSRLLNSVALNGQ
jgi:choline dehydrogenase-like flavoprotein